MSQFPSILTVYLTFFNFSLTLIVILRQGVFSADFESPNNTRVEVWWFRWWWVNVVNLNDTNYTLCLFEFSSLMRERSEKNYQRLSLNVIALKHRQCTLNIWNWKIFKSCVNKVNLQVDDGDNLTLNCAVFLKQEKTVSFLFVTRKKNVGSGNDPKKSLSRKNSLAWLGGGSKSWIS